MTTTTPTPSSTIPQPSTDPTSSTTDPTAAVQPAGAALPGPSAAELSRQRREARVDPTRPFGAHLRMRWWRALLVIPTLFVIMLGGQLVLLIGAMAFDAFILGKQIDPKGAMSPTMMLAANLSLALLTPAALLAMVFIGGVPWRSVVRNLPRPRLRRWLLYPSVFLGLIVIGLLVGTLVEPIPTDVTWNSGVLAFLALALFVTPFQAMGEEFMFRGAILPAVASWIRPVVPALIVGVFTSSVLFCLVHGAADPWLIAYYAIFGMCMALMAIVSRGLEAPIAFHAVNNVVFMVIGALMGGGEDLLIDRSAGAGGPWVLSMIGLDLLALAIVWFVERRARRLSVSDTAS